MGRFGSKISDQPLPSIVLEQQHRHFADSAILFQPIASYEGVGVDSCFIVDWPPNLTLRYEWSFFGGQYGLSRAWQETAGSAFVGLIDTIRTRVLRLALELKDDLGLVTDSFDELPKEKVDQSVITYIFGGNNVIASRDFAQVHSITIERGSWASLANALSGLGVLDSEIASLQSAVKEDSANGGSKTLGRRTATWLRQLGSKLGQAGLGIGIEVAKAEATRWIHQYLGLPPS